MSPSSPFTDPAAAHLHARILSFDGGFRARMLQLLPLARIDVATAITGLDADLDSLPPADLLLVHIGDEMEAESPVARALPAYLHRSGATLVCSTVIGVVDLVASRLPVASTHLLIDARSDEALLTIMAASESRRRTQRGARLRELGPDDAEAALARITEELGRMGRWLAALSEDVGSNASVRQAPVSYRPGPDRRAGPPPRPLDAARVRREIANRRAREHYIDDMLLGEPCWDMLLDLLAARLEGKKVSVSSLCIASAVPPTTALRWLKVITERGLVQRVADENDARRVFIELTDESAARLIDWFALADAP